MHNVKGNKVVYVDSKHIKNVIAEIQNNYFSLERLDDYNKRNIFFPLYSFGRDKFIGVLYYENGSTRIEFKNYDSLNHFYKYNVNKFVDNIKKYVKQK